MQLTLLVPLLACTAAVVVASAIVARDASDRANWFGGSALALAGLWAFFDALAVSAPDREAGLTAMRLVGLAYPFLAPVSLSLAAQTRPTLGARLQPAIVGATVGSAVLALGHASTSWFIADARPSAWGWMPVFGPLFPVVYVHTLLYAGLCGVALLGTADARLSEAPSRAVGRRALGAAALATAAVATLSDVLLPWVGIPGPRLAAASLVVLCGSAWLVNNRLDAGSLTANAFAREILDVLPEGVAILRGADRIRAANASLARMLGRPALSLVGLSAGDLLSEPPDPASAEAREHETWLRRDDGSLLPVSLTLSPLRDRQGYVLGRVMLVRDQREVVELRRSLVTSGRLAAVGELAAGIAHEVNNPIAYIRSNLSLLERHLEELADKGPGSEASDAAPEASTPDPRIARLSARTASCLAGVGRVAAIVREVRGFSHGGEAQRQLADVNELVEGALRLAAHRLRHCCVERDLQPLPAIEGAHQELKQVFLDLVLNAARAVGEGGHVRVSSRAEERGVRVVVEDDGCGIVPDALSRIFDPVASSQALERGRGLGLSISFQILRHHGGEISIQSQPASGTRVEVRLPAVDGHGGAP